MTENSMFFSDGSWYPQNVFARFIADIFGEGVVDGIDDELEVSANTPANMAVQVATGRSYIKGYIHEILTDPVTLTIADADPTNPRIDRIVLRLDVNTNRRIRVTVLQGTAAASPVAPTLTQTSSIWEISLAQVYVSANATVINTANITDERTYMTYQRANMPYASASAYGSVKIGSGVEVNNGVISVVSGARTVQCTASTTQYLTHTSTSSNSDIVLLPYIPTVTYSGSISGKYTSTRGGSAQILFYLNDGTITTESTTTSWATYSIPSNTVCIVGRIVNDTSVAQTGYFGWTNTYV